MVHGAWCVRRANRNRLSRNGLNCHYRHYPNLCWNAPFVDAWPERPFVDAFDVPPHRPALTPRQLDDERA